MNGIVIAAISMGAMGLLFGAALSFIGKKFAVPENPLKDAVREALPGANCAACGYAGCEDYAEAVADLRAAVHLCPVGGDAVSEIIGRMMGIEAVKQTRMIATIMCRGELDRCQVLFDYEGPKDCRSASLVANGDKACAYSCLGLGNCEKNCPFGAIAVNENRLATVDEEKCIGCGLCVEGCPRNVLRLLPRMHTVHVICSSMERGKAVIDGCTAGCVGCGKCERSCKFGAVKLVNNLPEIDLEKCVGCMKCADNCPTCALKTNEHLRKRAVIDYNECDRCGNCLSACPFEAIIKNEEGKHVVVAWDCTGCGVCIDKCAGRCIQLVHSVKYNR